MIQSTLLHMGNQATLHKFPIGKKHGWVQRQTGYRPKDKVLVSIARQYFEVVEKREAEMRQNQLRPQKADIAALNDLKITLEGLFQNRQVVKGDAGEAVSYLNGLKRMESLWRSTHKIKKIFLESGPIWEVAEQLQADKRLDKTPLSVKIFFFLSKKSRVTTPIPLGFLASKLLSLPSLAPLSSSQSIVQKIKESMEDSKTRHTLNLALIGLLFPSFCSDPVFNDQLGKEKIGHFNQKIEKILCWDNPEMIPSVRHLELSYLIEKIKINELVSKINLAQLTALSTDERKNMIEATFTSKNTKIWPFLSKKVLDPLSSDEQNKLMDFIVDNGLWSKIPHLLQSSISPDLVRELLIQALWEKQWAAASFLCKKSPSLDSKPSPYVGACMLEKTFFGGGAYFEGVNLQVVSFLLDRKVSPFIPTIPLFRDKSFFEVVQERCDNALSEKTWKYGIFKKGETNRLQEVLQKIEKTFPLLEKTKSAHDA